MVSREHPSQKESQIVYSTRSGKKGFKTFWQSGLSSPHHHDRCCRCHKLPGKADFYSDELTLDSQNLLGTQREKKNLEHTKMAGLNCKGHLQCLFTGPVFCKACFDLFSWCSPPGDRGGEHKINFQLQRNMGMTEKVLAYVTVNVCAAIAGWGNSS